MTTGAPLRIVLFGDSVFAGYGLPWQHQPATLLEARLRADGILADVTPAGVLDETAEDGLARVSSISGDLVLVEFGLNDAIRGVAEEDTTRALEAIVKDLQSRRCRVILVEANVPSSSQWPALTPPRDIIETLAKLHGTGFCPDILSKLRRDPRLLQGDGLHPNENGVVVMVDMLFSVITRAQA